MPPSVKKITLEGRFKDRMSRDVKKASSSIEKSLKGIAVSVVAPIAGFLAIQSLARKGLELADLAAQADGVSRSFDRLALLSGRTADVFKNELREAARGTISDLELMKKANEAALLAGENIIRELPKLIEIARASAAATGQSVEFLFQSIVLGIGRQSKLILDNLGILVQVDKANAAYAKTLGKQVAALTEAEKKQAFLNAVVKAGQRIIEDTGGAYELATDKAARLAAEQENLGLSIGQKLLPAVNLLRTRLSEVLGIIDQLLPEEDKLAEAQKIVAETVFEINRLAKERAELQAKGAELTFGEIAILEVLTRKEQALLTARKEAQAFIRSQQDEKLAAEEAEVVTAEEDVEVVLTREKNLLLRNEAQMQVDLLAEIENLSGEERLKKIQELAKLEVSIAKRKNQQIINFSLAQSQLLEDIGTAAGQGQTAIGRKFAAGQIALLKEQASASLKISQAQAVGEALKLPFPGNLVQAALITAKFAALRALVGAAGGAAISAVGGPPPAEGQRPPGVRPGPEERRLPEAMQPETAPQIQQLNLTVQALDPASADWDKIFQDNLKPAIEGAIDREVTVNLPG